MAKKTINPTIKITALLVAAALVGVGVLSALSGGHSSATTAALALQKGGQSSVSDGATGDTPVETLQTLTATMSAVQAQNRTVLQKAQTSQQQTQASIKQFEASENEQLQAALQQLQTNNAQYQAQMNASLQQDASTHAPAQYAVSGAGAGTGADRSGTDFVWISDLQTPYQKLAPITMANPVDSATSASSTSGSLLNNGNTSTLSNHSSQARPVYTLPVNSTLTGVIAMQPLLGEIPVDNRMVDPYHFKMIIGPQNLAANGVPIPSAIQGIVASGIAEGELIGPINKQACVRGTITSLTFVFSDGRISTTESHGSQGLGTISDAQGYPCISGILETNAPQYLGITFGLGALQGYAQGLSQAQMSSGTTAAGGNISTLVGSSSTFAAGQATTSGVNAVQNWFNQRMQNSTDLVVVDNFDAKTRQYKRFNINITQAIAINDDPNARKVSYETNTKPDYRAHLD